MENLMPKPHSTETDQFGNKAVSEKAMELRSGASLGLYLWLQLRNSSPTS